MAEAESEETPQAEEEEEEEVAPEAEEEEEAAEKEQSKTSIAESKKSGTSKESVGQKDEQEASETAEKGEEAPMEAEEGEETIKGAEDEAEGEGEEGEHETIVLTGFDAIRQHYIQVVETIKEAEVVDTEGMQLLISEYSRMFGEAETYEEKVQHLQQDVEQLDETIEQQQEELKAAAEEGESLNRTIETQQSEIEDLKRQLDASHNRERALQELSETMKNQIDQLNKQIQQIYKMSKDTEDDPSQKKKNALQRDIERLENEVTILTDRLKLANAIKDELDERIATAEATTKELNQTIDVQNQFLLKEQRSREVTEHDLQTANMTIRTKQEEIERLQKELKSVYDSYNSSEKHNKELKKSIERYDTDRENLRISNMKLSDFIDSQKENIKILKNTIIQKNEKIMVKEGQFKKLNEESQRIQKAREISDKRVHYLELKHSQDENEKTKLLLNIEHFHNEMQKMKRDREDDFQKLDAVTKSREYLKKTVTRLQSLNTSLEKQLQMLDSNKTKIEAELNDLIQNHNKVCQKLASTEKERDRHSATILELTDKLEDASDTVKDKLAEIYELKKTIYELTTKLRMQQNVFEVIRGERNTFEKLLIQSQDTTEELKGKVKLINSQVDQLKEQIALKEAQLIKEQKALAKMKKEKEELRVDLQKSQDELRTRKEEIKQLMKDKKNILRMNAILENEKNKQAIQIHHIMNERDILGTQLVRRNDEISLLYEKIKVMQDSFRKGEYQYNQRLEDIRLLKLEIKRLLHEKGLLAKHIKSTIDNRTAVLDLERNYIKAGLKVRALEEEVTTPLNIHRWRKLEGEDPEKLELIHKLVALQKRMVKYGYTSIKREEQMQEMMRVYKEVQQALVHAPSSDTIIRLTATQRTLQKRGKQMKCLVSELNMYQYEMSEAQFELKNVQNELHETKSELYKLKLEKDKQKLQSRERVNSPMEGKKRMLGGGFNMAAISSPTG